MKKKPYYTRLLDWMLDEPSAPMPEDLKEDLTTRASWTQGDTGATVSLLLRDGDIEAAVPLPVALHPAKVKKLAAVLKPKKRKKRKR